MSDDQYGPTSDMIAKYKILFIKFAVSSNFIVLFLKVHQVKPTRNYWKNVLKKLDYHIKRKTNFGVLASIKLRILFCQFLSLSMASSSIGSKVKPYSPIISYIRNSRRISLKITLTGTYFENANRRIKFQALR